MASDLINKHFPDVTRKVAQEAKAAEAGISSASARASSSGGMEARNREALQDYRSNLLRTVENLLGRGAASPSSPLHNRYLVALDEANKAARDISGMATGGLVTGPVIAKMGEGGRNEAVLPLNENVYRQIGQGIAAARGGGGMQLVVNYTGNGKWTREDAQGLGRMLVSELRSMGVRA
jgi:SLT domain-containing protein